MKDKMTTINDGGLARDNMTVRDEFAARAMQALIRIGTNEPSETTSSKGHTYDFPEDAYYFGDDIRESRLGIDAYGVADMMMAARSRQPDDDAEPPTTPGTAA